MIANQFFWPYLAASIVCIASPGPDSLTVLSLGLARGRREAMQFALGVGSGCLTHTLWAALGVAAVVAASQQLFIAIKLAGAAYLLWLGISALRSRGALAAGRLPSLGAARAARGGWQRYLNGFVSNSLNPKVMLFFIAFLPQFVDPALGPVSHQLNHRQAGDQHNNARDECGGSPAKRLKADDHQRHTDTTQGITHLRDEIGRAHV